MKFHSHFPKRLASLLLLTGAAAAATSCNLFSPIDKPSGDAQLLSAARACFDRGDFACARENYAKLSPSASESAAADQAFLTLDELGAGFSVFMSSFGKGDGSATNLIQTLTEAMIPQASQETRMKIYAAFKRTAEIRTNKELQGLVRFVTATALVSEILAEDASGAIFTRADLVADPVACSAENATSCDGSAACGKPAGKKLESGGALTGNDLDPAGVPVADTAVNTAHATMGLLVAAFSEINQGAVDMGATNNASGSLGSKVLDLFTFDTDGDCSRFWLINQGLGRN